MFNRNKRKRGLFAAMSLTLVAALGFAGAPSAMADTTPAQGNMPTSGKGTITIHKYDAAQGKDSNSGDGTKKTPAPTNDPLEGVKFTITKITDFDISSNENWDKLSKFNGHNLTITGTTLSADSVAGTFTLAAAPVETVTTAQDGSVTSQQLDFGAYLIQETDFGNNLITKKVDPFVVTIPYPNQTKGTTTWLTDVHVYPKNDLTTKGTKEVSNATNLHNVGDNIEWTITSKAPAHATKFGVVDQLEDYLTYVDDSAVVKFGNVTLTDNTDYMVTKGTKFSKAFVQIKLTQAGLAKIDAGGDVKFTVTTTLNSKLPPKGIADNNGFPITNDLDPFNAPGASTPGIPPITTLEKPHFGQYQFYKTDEKSGEKLTGAVFEICDKATDATCQSPLATATADANGVVKFEGIFLGLGDTHATREVVLHEKTAPAGYIKRADEDITLATGEFALVDDAAHNKTNAPQHGPNLPLTGAAGMVLLTLAGVAVFAIATGLGFVNKRRKNA